MKTYIIIPLLMVISSLSVNAANLYQTNNDKFWKEWWTSQKLLVSCKSQKSTTEFIVNALSYSGNAEVNQANAEEIEKLAINNPVCLVEGIAKLNNKQLKKFYNLFIKQAMFHSSNEIISSIKKNGKLSRFQNVQKLFE